MLRSLLQQSSDHTVSARAGKSHEKILQELGVQRGSRQVTVSQDAILAEVHAVHSCPVIHLWPLIKLAFCSNEPAQALACLCIWIGRVPTCLCS